MVANQNTIFNKQKGQVCKAMQLILGLIKYFFRQIFKFLLLWIYQRENQYFQS